MGKGEKKGEESGEQASTSKAFCLDVEQQEHARALFLASVEPIRPPLHQYCTRLVGSSLDGEDLVQETLATAYFKIALFREGISLRPWLFRIAHNKCIDFLRRRTDQFVSVEETETPEPAAADHIDHLEQQEQVHMAMTTLLDTLAPMERACVMLKDVLGFSLAEIANIVASTVGGVKSALHRGRTKLREKKPSTPRRHVLSSQHADLLQQYADYFNRKDWKGLAALISADARLEVVDRFMGEQRESITQRYVSQYIGLEDAYHLSIGYVDGEEVLLCWQNKARGGHPYSAIRLAWFDEQVIHIRDYLHVPYLFQEAALQNPRVRGTG